MALRASSTGVGRTWRSSSVCHIWSMISASWRSWRRRAVDSGAVGSARTSESLRILSSTERRRGLGGVGGEDGPDVQLVDDHAEAAGPAVVGDLGDGLASQPSFCRRVRRPRTRWTCSARWRGGSRRRRRGPGRWPGRSASRPAVSRTWATVVRSRPGPLRRPAPWIPWSAGGPAPRGRGVRARAGGPAIRRAARRPGVRRPAAPWSHRWRRRCRRRVRRPGRARRRVRRPRPRSASTPSSSRRSAGRRARPPRPRCPPQGPRRPAGRRVGRPGRASPCAHRAP